MNQRNDGPTRRVLGRIDVRQQRQSGRSGGSLGGQSGREGGVDIAVLVHLGVLDAELAELFRQQPRQVFLFLGRRRRI